MAVYLPPLNLGRGRSVIFQLIHVVVITYPYATPDVALATPGKDKKSPVAWGETISNENKTMSMRAG